MYVPVYQVQLVREGSIRNRAQLTVPDQAARAARSLIPDDGQEHFGVFLLDVRHRMIGALDLCVGSLSGAVVHPRELFAPAIVHKAAAVVLFHCHPSGDVSPSEEDIALTRRLVAGGALVGIEVLDHVIVSHDSVGSPYHSFSAHGQI